MAIKFEDYRQPWETGPHWELKREFIEKYSDMFPEDRLLCLAQAYSNVVLMNCSYPDPVMRQISLLSRPLQMRKRFQEGNSSTDSKTPKSQQQRVTEKLKSMYQDSGRPFKQIKFCASEEQVAVSSDANQNQPSVTVNNSVVKGNVEEKIKEETCKEKDIISAKQETCKEKDIISEKQETREEKDIISALGIELIKKFVELMRYFEMKRNTSVGIIAGAAQGMKLQDRISYDISLLPDSQSSTFPQYSCKLCIDNCVISKATAFKKKEAKEKSAQSAVNILINISRSSILQNNNLNPASSVVNIEQKDDADQNIDENMRVLQIFSEKVANRTKEQPAAFALKHITKDLTLQKYIAFDIITNNNSQFCPYVCKFFINKVLISSGGHMSITHAKESAVEIAFAKLENLSMYEIQNGELVEKQNKPENKFPDMASSHSIMKQSATETKEAESTPFILNSTLFNNSMRDGFMLLDNISLKAPPQQNARTMLQETVVFCGQNFEYKLEDDPENPFLKKASVIIAGKIAASASAHSRETAKSLACEKTVDTLRKRYYTLKVKNEYIDGYIIQHRQLFEGESFTSGILADSNIGCRMLKNMGWTGGALGSSGIAEPIEPHGYNSFGEGLGYGNNNMKFKDFRRRLNLMLQDYKNTTTLSSLVFSKEFSKEERKMIHRSALRYNLHSSSRGTDEERFLTVRHKYSVTELLQLLANNGGSSSKYELVDATEIPFTF